jgi:alpha-glucosidase (family GH31 glycosyl hydrolase)
MKETQCEVAGFCGDHMDYDKPVALRCTLCGAWSPGFGYHDQDAVMISDLTAWAAGHRCAPLRVT